MSKPTDEKYPIIRFFGENPIVNPRSATIAEIVMDTLMMNGVFLHNNLDSAKLDLKEYYLSGIMNLTEEELNSVQYYKISIEKVDPPNAISL